MLGWRLWRKFLSRGEGARMCGTGITQPNILYHMDRMDPVAAASRAADRVRVTTETAAAAVTLHGLNPTLSLLSEAGRLRRRLGLVVRLLVVQLLVVLLLV